MQIPVLSDIPDLKPAEPGEHDLYIRKAKDTKSNDGSRIGMLLIIDVTDEENIEPIMHNIWLPNANDDEDKSATMWRMIKEQIVGMGLDPDQENENSDFEGLSFSAILDLEEYQGNIKNVIKRITS